MIEHNGKRPLKIHYSIATFLSIILFTIYNLNLRSIDGVDTLPATLQPVSILKYGDLNLNEFDNFFSPQPHLWQAAFRFGSLQKRDQDIINSYPPGTAIMAAPFYGIARLLGILKPHDWNSYRLTGKLTASAMVALSAGILFLSLSHVTTLATSAWLTIAYALGTGAFSTASQALWQHGPGMLSLSIALLAICQLEYKHRNSHLIAAIAGTGLALAVLCRNLNVVPAVTLTLYMFVYHRKLLVSYTIPASIIAIFLLAYNYQTFDNFSGGYNAILGSEWHRSRQLLEQDLFRHPLAQGLLDTWLSPSKGFVIYSPFIIIALLFPFLANSNARYRLGGFLFLWLLLMSVVLAKNVLWWGGTSFGPRYLLETGIAAIFLIALVYQCLPAILAIALKLLIVVSISIHTLGAFYAPCGWAEHPTWADFHTERYWDWRDTEIARCAIRGWQQGPLPAEFSRSTVGPE